MAIPAVPGVAEERGRCSRSDGSPSRVPEVQIETVMEFVRNIDIEVIAAGLAGLVLVQLVLELRSHYRRARRTSRQGAFLQVQARRLPGAGAWARLRRPGRKNRGR